MDSKPLRSSPAMKAENMVPDISRNPEKLSDGDAKEDNNKMQSSALKNEHENAKPTSDGKLYNFIVRTTWTLIMILGFFIILASGHFWCLLLVVGCQVATFKECIAVTGQSAREKNLPLTRTLNWYFLFTTIYYLEGKSLFKFFKEHFINYRFLSVLAANHKFICYCLAVLGFIIFVCSLRKGFLKFQFSSLCITHMVLILVVVQAHMIIKNLLNGLIWFLLPCGLVIVNDIFAYLCGITFGKTKLIAISPKKTLEGFLGAWFFTGLASIILAKVFMPYSYMTCPVTDLHTNIFTPLRCETNPVFIPKTYKLPLVIFEKLGFATITIKPVYFHVLNLATFASLFAPFGGFFASGLKRTFKVKDFGQSIPGHGGITDRVDCQFLMGSFMNLYYDSFISEKKVTVESILSTILMSFDERQIIHLIHLISNSLLTNGIIPQSAHEQLLELYQLEN